MTEWKAKRFWKSVETAPQTGGYGVLLDGRPVKTPGKLTLILPTQSLADLVAAEWQAQEGKIRPETMPATKTANSAIDKVAVQHKEVADMIAAYGDSDLLCYRADTPKELVERQAEAWDPYLDWAADTLGARLEPRTGVIHVAQDTANTDRLRALVHEMSNFELAAFHDLVALTGSLILGFAAVHQFAPPSEIWNSSRTDENWQEEQWGEDEEASALSQQKFEAFIHAENFFRLARVLC